MKVILLKDVAKMGKKFDVKEVPNGYATHLIRTGVVEMATANKLANIDEMKTTKKVAREGEQTELAAAIAKIKDVGISITAKANDDGGLFEGITAVKLQEAIADSIVELPISAISLSDPIKEVGEHLIELVNDGVTTKVALTISAEG